MVFSIRNVPRSCWITGEMNGLWKLRKKNPEDTCFVSCIATVKLKVFTIGWKCSSYRKKKQSPLGIFLGGSVIGMRLQGKR